MRHTTVKCTLLSASTTVAGQFEEIPSDGDWYVAMLVKTLAKRPTVRGDVTPLSNEAQPALPSFDWRRSSSRYPSPKR